MWQVGAADKRQQDQGPSANRHLQDSRQLDDRRNVPLLRDDAGLCLRGRSLADSFPPAIPSWPSAPVRVPAPSSGLAVNQPGEPREQEAVRVTEHVMRMPQPDESQAPSKSYDAETSLQRECAHCAEEDEQERLQRKDAGAASDVAPSIVHEVLNSPGQPLDSATRDFMEPRFGHDFSQVRVHADERAAESASAVDALAYTVGRDVIFSQGSYVPHSYKGSELLAHELAHVVQQRSANSAPMVRRRLFVSGDAKDIKALFNLLEPASGFRLNAEPQKKDPKINQITATASVLRPPSSVLAAELLSIMEDTQQDAELHLGRTQAGTTFGAFPFGQFQTPEEGKPLHLVQEIRIDQLVDLEKGAPGSGVEILAHELIENYHAHSPELLKGLAEGGLSEQNVFEKSHRAAIEKENLIIGELGHPGTVHAMFQTMMGREPHRFFRWIKDLEQYFIIWDAPFDDPAKSDVSNARRVPPVKVSSYSIEGLGARPVAISAELSQMIGKASDDLAKNLTAAARIEALVSVYDLSNPRPESPQEWAERIGNTLESELDSKIPGSARVLEPRSNRTGTYTSAERSTVTISVNRPEM